MNKKILGWKKGFCSIDIKETGLPKALTNKYDSSKIFEQALRFGMRGKGKLMIHYKDKNARAKELVVE